uniref:Diacylglycerol kinase family enzyme n=1 Tax=Candidatus Kentrum sp. FM TaxID=2126340 RepID=A0A450U1Y0_9GAMM|nr:MAG: Diacylglycerol kinase family enzyme [Candidatus Kentron sp. FM]VFJ76608.1 MAG: Diacylglycerol kinase family enzyme [Candidatus Kentron sp. FM]VFK22863.1 MAG: Diacylglycerol kinase family enzyme [Candidatus Kentron sp. FM]
MKRTKRIGIVFNPAKNMKSFNKALEAFKNEGFELDIVGSESFDDFMVRTQQLTQNSNMDMLVIGGGDGSVLAGINGMASFEIPVGILPLGCSNDFAHSLGIHHMDDAIHTITEGKTKKVDLGEAGFTDSNGIDKKMYFSSTAGIGFISSILEIENKPFIALSKKLIKDTIWPILAFYRALFLRYGRVIISVNDIAVFSGKITLLEVSKVKKVGGVLLTPDAELDNGYLDFWMVERMNLFKFLYSILAKVFSSRYRELEHITYFSSGQTGSPGNAKVKRLHIEAEERMPFHLNGEYLGDYSEVSFDICNTHRLNMLYHEVNAKVRLHP